MTTIDELIEKLAPCPFCGGTPVLDYLGEWGRFDNAEASCLQCGFSIDEGSHVEGAKEAMAAAAARWNTRAPDPTLSSLLEHNRKLEETLAGLLSAAPVVEAYGAQVSDCDCRFCRARALLSGDAG